MTKSNQYFFVFNRRNTKTQTEKKGTTINNNISFQLKKLKGKKLTEKF
jgi:hypothetical protein